MTEFECGVCFEEDRVPMLNVGCGHTYCNGCWAGVSACPTCRADKTQLVVNNALVSDQTDKDLLATVRAPVEEEEEEEEEVTGTSGWSISHQITPRKTGSHAKGYASSAGVNYAAYPDMDAYAKELTRVVELTTQYVARNRVIGKAMNKSASGEGVSVQYGHTSARKTQE